MIRAARPFLAAFLPILLCEAADPPLRPAPVTRTEESKSALTDYLLKVNPSSDEQTWAAEAFADRASTALKKLATVSEHAGHTDDKACSAFTADTFATPPLRPAVLRSVFRDASLNILRGDADKEVPREKGPARMAGALDGWKAAYPAGSEVHTKFKIVTVNVDAAAGTARTTAFVQSSAETPAGPAQQSATWTCQWKGVTADETPLLTAITVCDYEEVQPVHTGKSPPLFVDAAPLVLGNTPAWKDFLVHGLDHWFKQVDIAFQIPQGYHGASVRDIDGDEREDVFLCQPAGIHNMLFKRMPDGTLTDVSAKAGLDFLDNSSAALFVDLDNDGDADGVVSLGYAVHIFENDGKGRFTARTGVDMNSWIMSIVAADYDLDGRVDLYFCGYTPRNAVGGGDLLANPVPIHNANNGARNFLLHNDGSLRFSNATESTGMDVNNRRFTFAAAWEDFDNDGDQDLYCANDFGKKNLYRNDLIKNGQRSEQARFTDIAEQAGVIDTGSGMSAVWADYDHDGNMDLYVANMFSSAGRRIASQQSFKAGDTAENRAGILRLARGNSLFRNKGDGTFDDLGESSGTFLGRWAWASLFVDLNNDSWDDLFVCNGFYTRPDPADL
jgi:hypothetical protein